jgi:tRNA (guanine-N7-)-methyltransferase
VNPLTRQHQQPVALADTWPRNVFFDHTDDDHNTSGSNIIKPLHLDIGCGKGGFLLQLAAQEINSNENDQYNYLGLEIRHSVADFAKERISRRIGLTGRVEFLGCNANVDLDRLLQLYHSMSISNTKQDKDDDRRCYRCHHHHHHLLRRVTIQYPDPHFKARHAKRRVVTPELVEVLAKYMRPLESASSAASSSGYENEENAAILFLQSDLDNVLQEMQRVFEEDEESSRYFTKLWNHTSYTADDNPLHFPTEREVSVLKQGLPVYRALFVRNNVPYDDDDDENCKNNSVPPAPFMESHDETAGNTQQPWRND